MSNIIIQIIGFAAYIILAISYFCKKKSQILIWNIVASLILAVHFYLLSGLSGALCNVIGAAAMAAIYFYEKRGGKNKKLLIGLMFPVGIVIALLSWQGIISLLPIAASIVLIAGFIFEKPQQVRITGVIGGLLWLIYSIFTGSIAGVACEIVVTTATVIALFVNQNRSHKLSR